MISGAALGSRFPLQPLGALVEFLDHLRRPITESDRVEGPNPYYGANGLQGRVAGYIFDEPLILLAEDGGHFDDPSRGIAYKVRGKTWINNHAHVLRPKAGIDLDYLCRVLENYDVMPFVAGTTRLKLTKSGAMRIQIPVPPIEEQRRIAHVLDQADGLRGRRRKALVLVDELTRSMFLDMFGDPRKGRLRSLADVCTFVSGFAWRSDRFSTEVVGVPVIRIQNVNPGRQVEFVYWPDAYDSRFLVAAGDILLTLSGSFRVVEWQGPEALLNQRIVRLHPGPGIGREWLTHAISHLAPDIEALGRHALVNNVALSDLKQLAVAVPEAEQMRLFGRRVVALREVRTAMFEHQLELEQLFGCLQQRGFDAG